MRISFLIFPDRCTHADFGGHVPFPLDAVSDIAIAATTTNWEGNEKQNNSMDRVTIFRIAETYTFTVIFHQIFVYCFDVVF